MHKGCMHSVREPLCLPRSVLFHFQPLAPNLSTKGDKYLQKWTAGGLLPRTVFFATKARPTISSHGWASMASPVRVVIFNYQMYQHIEPLGWRLSWTWQGDEVIWNMWGVETTEQGNCSAFRGKQLPHCCEKKPVIIDLMPGASYNKQVANCCKRGVLSSITQGPNLFGAAF
ncbi:hypothetical protein HYC85_032353 [Camellia sinensis]|uniref:COBRA-like protein n=1 Tax=Camellia sinensis TaxID=4442 RepID=A0A7J7FSW8_CAMSI|nr:hypothetical protein HYC85_032353 [Camellia sinensis]